MAIANYVATATPIAGGESINGYVVYDGAKAYIIPSGATLNLDAGVLTCTSDSIVEVDPASVKLESLNLQNKTITELTATAGAITPDEGYDGIGSVTIQSVKLQDKTVSPSYYTDDNGNPTLEVTKDEADSWGLGEVTVNRLHAQSKTVDATKTAQAVVPDSGYNVLIGVQVNGYTPKLQAGVELEPGLEEVTVEVDEGFDGLSSVTVKAIPVEEKTVNGSKTQQIVEPTEGKYLTKVTVEGYTPVLQTRVIGADNPLTTEMGAIVPEEGYDGIGSLTIESVKLQDVSVDPTTEGTTAQKTDSTAWGLGTVTVNAPQLDEVITVDPSDEQQTKTPTGIGFKGVIVNAVPVDTEHATATPDFDEQVITPDTGKYFKQFTVAPAPLEEAFEVTPSKIEQDFFPSGTLGYKGVTVKPVPVATNNTATPTLEEQTIIPEGGYFDAFTVAPAPLAESTTVQPTEAEQTVEIGEGMLGIKGVTVGAIPVDSTGNSYTPTKEGATVTAEGYFKTFIIDPVPTEQRTIVPADEDQTIVPTEGKFFDQVVVKADVDAPLQTKTVTPTLAQQVITPDEGYGGLSSVTVAVAPVDEEITVQSGTADEVKTPTGLGFKSVKVTGDADLIPENIKEGVEILGVTGTLSSTGEPGTQEAGFEAGHWVALDLPESVTRKESFKVVPCYNDHYIGKTFDGGEYMAIAIYNKYGKAVMTVMLNDILDKYYLEDLGTKSPFSSKSLVLAEDTDSSDIDWSTVSFIQGNGHEIKVDAPLTIGDTFTASSVVFTAGNGVTELFASDALQVKVDLTNCTLVGFHQTVGLNVSLSMNGCTVRKTAGRSSDKNYLVTLDGGSVVAERSIFEGDYGILVKAGKATLRANTFKTTAESIKVEGNVILSIEGNIFNNLSGYELVMDDSVTDPSGIYVIGAVEIEGNFKIEGNSVVSTVDTPVTPPEPEETATDKVVRFFNELSQDAVSNYMVSNKDAVMAAFGVTEGSSVGEIGQLLYDKLQGGDTVEVDMNDGGKLKIHGHFYEPSDDFPYWDMYVEYEVPEGGTNKCFPEGSQMSVKGGSVTLHITNGEMTNWDDKWYMVLLVYGYIVDITNVTVTEEEESFVLNIAGLTRPNDFSNPCIIDPDSNTWEIYVRQFYLPDSDAEGTITADGEPALWSEVVGRIEK